MAEWLHSGISRDDAEALVTAAGLDDGRFLVRTRDGKPNEYVLCVVYKGKPTHHLIAKNAEGSMVVNKKAYGDNSTVEELIGALGKKQPGWPVGLDKPVAAGGASGTKSEKKKKSGTAGSKKAWLVDASREEAEKMVAVGGLEDGNFVVRTREGKPNEYILCVVYKGKPTHHLVAKNAEKLFTVNKKAYGENKTIAKLIATLGKPKVAGWPVPLVNPKAPAAEEPEAAPEPEPEPEPAAAAAPEPEPEPVVAESQSEALVAAGLAEPAAETTTAAPTTEAAPASAAEAYAEEARKAASDAYASLAAKKAELEALRNVSTTGPTKTISAAGGSSSTDGGLSGEALTVALARAVIKMGQRMSKLEGTLTMLAQQLDNLDRMKK